MTSPAETTSGRPEQSETGQAPPDTSIPALPADALILLPVRHVVLFPGVLLPIAVGRKRSIAAAQEAARSDHPIGVILQRNDAVEEPMAVDLHQVGTAANILRYVTAPDGGHHIITQGIERFRIIEMLDGYPYLVARVERIAETEAGGTEIEARFHILRQRAIEALELLPQAPQELLNAVQSITSPGVLADVVTSYLDLSAAEKQEVLETFDLRARLDRVIILLGRRIEVLRLSREITNQTKETIDERQREFLLREQLRVIQKQLGEGDSQPTELQDLATAIDAAQMPPEVEKQARQELKRLERLPEASAEYPMVRTYLEWLTELPWSKRSGTEIDIDKARRVLDEEHFGLEKIKRRILEFLAVRKLAPEGKGPILCFVGPPGVGKTSLGQSIAHATGRQFQRLSLGGIHDEAEIRGHRRTYIGALPGNIIQAVRKAGTRDCVIMLDEVDKLGGSFRGDPSSALLEVLDPEQNSTFRDTYLGVPFDLSEVLFIATANVLDSIPGPLRDRMEVIELSGYTEQEKMEIARHFLVPRQRAANGVHVDQCEITDPALHAIIHDYTREAGCRNLERAIGAVFRRVAMRIAEGNTEPVTIQPDDLPAILGPPRFESEVAMRTAVPGVATGLAWTPVGGDILFIEATRMPGKGNLIITGQLGDVMKESTQAALSLVKSRARDLGIRDDIFEKSDIHIHVPAGAIPKDGPSAGVAMFASLVSLLTGRTIRSDLAMTGEISLRGLVLPVGGIKEKVVAAARAGIAVVILPARNRRDFEDIPDDARRQLTFIWAERVDQVLEAAFTEGSRVREAAVGA